TNWDGAEHQHVNMWNAQAVLARGSMAAAFHTPFQTASKNSPQTLHLKGLAESFPDNLIGRR
ncbi:MAG: hypothetical protein MI924_28475, partial [Chloroflexales bacterium]|nr:hypothetical protein [Chloroflexales bacterium]